MTAWQHDRRSMLEPLVKVRLCRMGIYVRGRLGLPSGLHRCNSTLAGLQCDPTRWRAGSNSKLSLYLAWRKRVPGPVYLTVSTTMQILTRRKMLVVARIHAR